MYHGLGFEQTFSSAEPETDLSAAITGAVSSWDWHEWVLAAVAGYLVIRSIGSAFGSASGSVKRRVRKSKQRKERIKRARRDLERAEES